MLEISCCACKRTLDKQGGLLFSPPRSSNTCIKLHLCETCWDIKLPQITAKTKAPRKKKRLSAYLKGLSITKVT